MLGDDYDRIMNVYPDFAFVVEYIIMVSNAVATGKFGSWSQTTNGLGKLEKVLMNGVYGFGSTRAE
jgi:hypothetical protein